MAHMLRGSGQHMLAELPQLVSRTATFGHRLAAPRHYVTSLVNCEPYGLTQVGRQVIILMLSRVGEALGRLQES